MKHRVWRMELDDGTGCVQVVPDGATEEEFGELVFRLFIGYRVAAWWPHRGMDEQSETPQPT